MTEDQARQLGRVIYRSRVSKGLSLRALEEATGISYSWITRLERGRFAAPAPERISLLAEVLDIAPERIDRLSRGRVSAALPSMRTYLRTKYDLTAAEIAKIERVVARTTEAHERRGSDERRDGGSDIRPPGADRRAA